MLLVVDVPVSSDVLKTNSGTLKSLNKQTGFIQKVQGHQKIAKNTIHGVIASRWYVSKTYKVRKLISILIINKSTLGKLSQKISHLFALRALLTANKTPPPLRRPVRVKLRSCLKTLYVDRSNNSPLLMPSYNQVSVRAVISR
jgi:type II secretory pathway component PulK